MAQTSCRNTGFFGVEDGCNARPKPRCRTLRVPAVRVETPHSGRSALPGSAMRVATRYRRFAHGHRVPMVTINSVVLPIGNGAKVPPCRIVYIDAVPEGRIAYLVPLDKQALPMPMPEQTLLKELESGSIRLSISTPSPKLKQPDDLSPRHITIRDAAWQRISPLVEGASLKRMMHSDTRGSLVAGRAKELSCQPTQLYRDLYRYFRGGMDKDALYPNFRSVEVGSHQPDGQLKRGRKPSDVKAGRRPNNPPITELERRQIIAIIKKESKIGMTKVALHDMVNERLRNAGVIQEGKKTRFVLLPPHLRITTAQFDRVFSYADEGNAISRRLVGAKEWNSKCRWRSGLSHADISGPGQRYEIDWCGLQVEITAQDHPDRKIGTAIAYFVVDTWSNLIVGFHVTIAGASWDSASLALFNAVSAKATYYKHYGIALPDDDYNSVQGTPFSIRGDQGPDVISFASYSATHGLGSDFQNARVEQPRDKADVETTNSIFKRGLCKRLKGYRPKLKNLSRRNPRKDACLSLYDLTQIVMLEIIEVNRRTLSLASIPSIARKHGVRPTPIALWNWGIRNTTGYLRTEDPDVLYTKLLPEVDASITADGLKWKGFHFTCPALERQDVFSTARRSGRRTPVKIRVDPQRPWLVYVPKRGGNGYWPCTRMDPEGHFAKYLFEDAQDETAAHKAVVRKIREDEAQRQSDKRAEQIAIQRRAAVRAKEAGAVGLGGTKATVRRNRSEELEVTTAEHRRIVSGRRAMASVPRNKDASKTVSRIDESWTRKIVAAMAAK